MKKEAPPFKHSGNTKRDLNMNLSPPVDHTVAVDGSFEPWHL